MTAIYLEITEKKCFACALEWPGWCRSGKNEEAACEALSAVEPRYRIIAQRAGFDFEPGELVVVERVAGDSTTSFGAPSMEIERDRQPKERSQVERQIRLLRASWAILDEVAAASPAELRKGPRGGGRDRDAIIRHVQEAERSYARKIGIRHKPFQINNRVALSALRQEITEILSGPPSTSDAWLPSYALRRITWHVVEHIWEIEDRM